MGRGATDETMSTDWIPGAGVGLIGSAVAWLISWRINSARLEGHAEEDERRNSDLRLADEKRNGELRAADELRNAELRASAALRDADLRQDLRDLKEDWKAGIADVRKLADNMASLQSSQNVFNTVTAKAMDTMTDKLGRHDATLADHTSTLRLLTDVVMSKREREK